MIRAFPPLDTLSGFAKNEDNVPGIQANIWTERIQNEPRLDYMTHPRLSALAESAWTTGENKNLDDFKVRLKHMLVYLKSLGIDYYNPYAPEETPEPHGNFRRNIKQKKR